MAEERISLNEAARRAGVTPATLKRWAEDRIVPVKRGRWTPVAAAQARVVARMRDRGYTLEQLRDAAREGKLAFGYTEELVPEPAHKYTVAEAAAEAGLEPELIGRLMSLLGTPTGPQP